jgi:hypothetical protein
VAAGRKPLVPRCEVRRLDAEHAGDPIGRHMGAFVLDDQLNLRRCGVEGHLGVFIPFDLKMGATAARQMLGVEGIVAPTP